MRGEQNVTTHYNALQYTILQYTLVLTSKGKATNRFGIFLTGTDASGTTSASASVDAIGVIILSAGVLLVLCNRLVIIRLRLIRLVIIRLVIDCPKPLQARVVRNVRANMTRKDFIL